MVCILLCIYVLYISVCPSVCPLHQPHQTKFAAYDLSMYAILIYCMCAIHVYDLWHVTTMYIYSSYICIPSVYTIYVSCVYFWVYVLCMYTM